MASPTDVAGLLAWYEADQLTLGAGLANAAAVATWKDLSGNGTDATQGTGANQPTVATAALNGLPIVSFNGTTHVLLATIANTGQPFTVLIVYAAPIASGGNILLGSQLNAEIAINGTTIEVLAPTVLTGTGAGAGAYQYVTAVFNGNSGLIRSNGSQIASGAVGANGPGTSLSIGANPADSAPLKCTIAEVIVYTGALSAGNITTVETYLAAKYFTAPAAPVATSQAASGIGQTTATLNGQVTPNNEYTTYQFQWGLTNAYGSTTTLGAFSAGSAAQAVSAALSGLSGSTTYHYRLVAINTTGTTNGADQTFTTTSGPPQRAFYDRPRHQVLIGQKDLSERCDSIVYSATDSGGFEIATLGLPAVDRPKKGEAVTIRQGLEVAWSGRVAEIADHSQHAIATKTTGCEGNRALLRDTLFSMIYVDRDLSRWGAPSLTRQIALAGANKQLQSSQAAPDQTSGTPALSQLIQNDWSTPWLPICEAWYDAGPGNLIARLYYDLVISANAVGASFQEFVQLSSDANAGLLESSANLNSASEQTGYLAPATPYRFALAQHLNALTGQGGAGFQYNASWKNLALYGNHGLTLRGADPGGFYPSDIARHALSQCAGVLAGQIIDAIGYTAPHVVYRTPTAADVIIDDMAKLMGWTWGVWEPSTILGSQPRLDFRPPPTDATTVVSKAECDQLDITSRLGDLYDICEVSYTDAAGKGGIATVTLANPALYETGIGHRTLQLDMGLASQAAAATFGSFALALSQIAARAAGSATLPVSVRLPGGGSKPACLLRPGIDRLRIIDLTDGGPLLDIGTVRRDVFRISRVETTVSKDGSVSTVAELDNGTNLLETLQARLALAASVVGSGAS